MVVVFALPIVVFGAMDDAFEFWQGDLLLVLRATFCLGGMCASVLPCFRPLEGLLIVPNKPEFPL